MESYLRKRGTRLALLVLICLASIVLIYWLRDVFAPLLFAFLLAYMLNPVVAFLSRVHLGSARLSRSMAVGVVFGFLALCFLATVITGGYYLGHWAQQLYENIRGEPSFASQSEASEEAAKQGVVAVPEESRNIWYFDTDQDGKYWPGYARLIIERAKEFSERSEIARGIHKFCEEQIERKDGIFNPEKLKTLAKEYAAGWFKGRSDAGSAVPNAGAPSSGIGLFAKLSWFLLCPVYLFFIMLRFDNMIETVRRHLPGRHRPRIERVVSRIDRTIASFLRGRLLVCLCKGVLTAIGLSVLGVDNGILLGLLSGFLSLIPYVGVLMSAIPALILTWFEYSQWGRVVGVAGVYFAIEGIEGFVLVPAILGKEIGLSPLTVLVTLFVFAKLLGFIGVLLSVPLAAICKILGEEFLMPIIREFASEKPPPDTPAPGVSNSAKPPGG